MAQTQKIYLGSVPLIKNYFGTDPIVSLQNYTVSEIAIDWLLVAGGGGSGNDNAGGGGAGGLRSGSFTALSAETLNTILGEGGIINTNGNLSSISSSLFFSSSLGGGFGSTNSAVPGNGGSGGGRGSFGVTAPGGLGTAGQGNDGGASFDSGTVNDRGGSGGGASTAGTNSASGDGAQWLDGNYYSGGGGGGKNAIGAGIITGGIGGGGNGGVKFNDTYPATAGTPNTGGGGGGDGTGTSGGSGIIIFRYPDTIPSGSVTGGDSITTTGGYIYHKFTNVATSSLSINL